MIMISLIETAHAFVTVELRRVIEALPLPFFFYFIFVNFVVAH